MIKAKRKRGERDFGSTVPPSPSAVRTRPQGYQSAAKRLRRDPEVAIAAALRSMSSGGALCRPSAGPCRCQCHCRRRAGRERPPLPSPLLRPMVQLEGVAHAQDACHIRPAKLRRVRDTVECAARCNPRVRHVRVRHQHVGQVLPGTSVHIGERASSLNSDCGGRRLPPPAFLPPARLDRLASSRTAPRSRVPRPSRREIVRRSAIRSSHSASLRPLRGLRA